MFVSRFVRWGIQVILELFKALDQAHGLQVVTQGVTPMRNPLSCVYQFQYANTTVVVVTQCQAAAYGPMLNLCMGRAPAQKATVAQH